MTTSGERFVEVPEGLDGERLDAALARMFGLSRARAAELIGAGQVLVDGQPAAKSDRVLAGAPLTVTLPPPDAAPAVRPEPVPGLVIVYERLIIQATVSDELMGRAFGAQAALDGTAFAGSYVVAGLILALVGPRVLFLIGGLGALLVWIVARVVFARTRLAEVPQPAVAVPTEAAGAEQTAIAALEAHR